jgi:DNA-binding NarL/FixJ family response regulator
MESLIRGSSIKEISLARKVAIQTTWRQRDAIFRKLGVRSQVELVRVATEWQLQHQQQ